MKEIGYDVPKSSFKAFSEGSDYIMFDNGSQYIMFNTFNGSFFVVKEGKTIATERSEELETESWYVNLLNAFYEPLKEL